MAFIKIDKLATSLFIALQIARWALRVLANIVMIPVTWFIRNVVKRGGIGTHRVGAAALEPAWGKSETYRKRYVGKHHYKRNWSLAA